MNFNPFHGYNKEEVNKNIDEDIRFFYITTDKGSYYLKVYGNKNWFLEKGWLFEDDTHKLIGECTLYE